jgi:DNA repair exonuclease SbcCD ATPase subunit
MSISFNYFNQEQLAAIRESISQSRLLYRKAQREMKTSQTTIIEILKDTENIDIDCSICLETHKKTKCIYITKCKHMFCKSDFYDWMRKEKTCPLCRTQCNEIIDYC